MLNKIKSVVIGHAVADALGVPVEFLTRDEIDADPVLDMREYGTHSMPLGCWSDDTSMTLCALDAFSEGKIDFDQVMRNFSAWLYRNAYTPTGYVFDVGGTCRQAINNYAVRRLSWQECGLTDADANGNGSLMRIHPFVLHTYLSDGDVHKKIETVELASALTHAHPISKTACGIYAFVLWELLARPEKQSVSVGLQKAYEYYRNGSAVARFARLFAPDFSAVRRDDIKSTGYVVATLEAAVWCLLTTDSYRDCVLKAVNLGSDTDTVGAVAGGLAGALYGYDAIPQEWKNCLIQRDEIEKMCEKLLR